MSKKEIEQLEKRIDRIEKCLELLEMETKENGEIPHFKPRGKTIFFEKKELIKWIKKKGRKDSGKNRKNSKSST